MSGKHRGFSAGTIAALLLTLVIGGSMWATLAKLGDGTNARIDTGKMLEVLNLAELQPADGVELPKETAATAAPAAKTAAAPAQATAAPLTVRTGTVTVGGSIMIDTELRRACYFNDAKSYDFSDILSPLVPVLESDVAVVSLENLIWSEAKLSDNVTAEAVIDMIARAGIESVALGYPKAYDQGLPGLSSTIAALNADGLAVNGAHAAEESNVVIYTAGSVRVAWLHYTDALSKTGSSRAKKDENTWAVPLASADTIASDIRQARSSGADAVIVSVNWGTDDKLTQTKAQKQLAQQIADAGADVIVGTGANYVQSPTWLDRRNDDGSTSQVLCAWSLGTLLGSGRKDNDVAGMVLHFGFTVQDGEVTVAVSATPTFIWRYDQDGRSNYRVIAAIGVAPDGMNSTQSKARAKALSRIQERLSGTGITIE